MEFLNSFERIFSSVSALIAGLAVVLLVWSALRAGAIRQLSFGPLKIEGAITTKEISAVENAPPGAKEPFEIPVGHAEGLPAFRALAKRHKARLPIPEVLWQKQRKRRESNGCASTRSTASR